MFALSNRWKSYHKLANWSKLRCIDLQSYQMDEVTKWQSPWKTAVRSERVHKQTHCCIHTHSAIGLRLIGSHSVANFDFKYSIEKTETIIAVWPAWRRNEFMVCVACTTTNKINHLELLNPKLFYWFQMIWVTMFCLVFCLFFFHLHLIART